MSTATAQSTAKPNSDESSEEPSRNIFQRIFKTIVDTVGEFLNDNCTVLAGAVAFSALQSVIPLLLGFIAVGSLFLQDKATRNEFVHNISTAIPSELNNAGVIDLDKIIQDFINGAGAVSYISILILLWTGSGMFGQLKYAVNVAFDVERDERNILIQIGLQLLMVVILGGLLIAALAISFISGLIFEQKFSIFGISPYNASFLLPVISYILPIALEAIVFSFVYKLSPARQGVRWKPVLLAGFLTALLFELLKFLFGLYLSIFQAANNAAKTYGAIGGVFVFLFFLYLAAVVILFGAELAATLHHFGSGLAAVRTHQAVIETEAEEVDGELVPKRAATRLKEELGATTQPVDNQAKPVGPPSDGATPPLSHHDAITTLIGGGVVVAVAALNLLLNRKHTAK